MTFDGCRIQAVDADEIRDSQPSRSRGCDAPGRVCPMRACCTVCACACVQGMCAHAHARNVSLACARVRACRVAPHARSAATYTCTLHAVEGALAWRMTCIAKRTDSGIAVSGARSDVGHRTCTAPRSDAGSESDTQLPNTATEMLLQETPVQAPIQARIVPTIWSQRRNNGN